MWEKSCLCGLTVTIKIRCDHQKGIFAKRAIQPGKNISFRQKREIFCWRWWTHRVNCYNPDLCHIPTAASTPSGDQQHAKRFHIMTSATPLKATNMNHVWWVSHNSAFLYTYERALLTELMSAHSFEIIKRRKWTVHFVSSVTLTECCASWKKYL